MIRRAIITLALLIGIITLVPSPANAANPSEQFAACSSGIANFLGFESWDGCLKAKYGTTKIAALNDIWLIALPLIDSAVKAAGYVSVGFVIWGGIKYLKSQGEPAELNTARMIIHNALLGLILCILSVSIVQFAVSGIK